MKSIITAGLTKERSEEISGEFKHSAFLRERIIEVLRQKNDAHRANIRQKTTYDSPSWAYIQADAVGYERAIYEVINLISSESVT